MTSTLLACALALLATLSPAVCQGDVAKVVRKGDVLGKAVELVRPDV